MNDPIRQAFEQECYPSFGVTSGHSLRRKPSGEYVSDTLEDHWQTFQEGWEAAVAHLKQKTNVNHTDVASDGGLDPRDREHIGYTEREEGFYKLYAPPRGSIVTQAFILCKYCDGAIHPCGGPKYDAVCTSCYAKGPWIDEEL